MELSLLRLKLNLATTDLSNHSVLVMMAVTSGQSPCKASVMVAGIGRSRLKTIQVKVVLPHLLLGHRLR
jgi:hypothetical protein